MEKKDIAELRKTLKKEKSCIHHIYGYYFDTDKSFITELNIPMTTMQDEEFEKYCALFGKAVSGKLGKALYNVAIPAAEELDGGRQALLMNALQSQTAMRGVADNIAVQYTADGRFAVCFAQCTYDVPGKATDGTMMEDASDIVYE